MRWLCSNFRVNPITSKTRIMDYPTTKTLWSLVVSIRHNITAFHIIIFVPCCITVLLISRLPCATATAHWLIGQYYNRLLRLMTESAFSSDGERIVDEWCLEWRHDIPVTVRRSDVISGQHPWPCTQGHLTLLSRSSDLALKVIYIIIGTVGVLDNLFVLIIFILFININEKVKTLFFTARCHAERGYATVCMSSARLSVCTVHDHIGWNTSKLISRPNSLRYLSHCPQHGRFGATGTLPKLGWNRGGGHVMSTQKLLYLRNGARL